MNRRKSFWASPWRLVPGSSSRTIVGSLDSWYLLKAARNEKNQRNPADRVSKFGHDPTVALVAHEDLQDSVKDRPSIGIGVDLYHLGVEVDLEVAVLRPVLEDLPRQIEGRGLKFGLPRVVILAEKIVGSCARIWPTHTRFWFRQGRG
jgi:hypothetical protein